MYVTPTSRGVATVACVGGPSPRTCGSVAATVGLQDGVRAYRLGPVPAYGRAVDAAVRRLERRRGRALRDLRRARTARGQGAAAGAVGTAYRRAAAELSRAPATPLEADAHAAMREAFSNAASTYRSLGAAARARERRRYATRREQATRRDAAARRAVAELERLGYRVG
jgi:hypothetical protein